MGRVRRNQRDGIRKQRAKRRVRKTGADDSDNAYIKGTASKTRRLSQEGIPVDSTASVRSSNGKTETEQQSLLKSEKNQEGITSIYKSTQNTKQTTKRAPLDRIERMKLKKQQQKARRKEKKEARASAAARKKDA